MDILQILDGAMCFCLRSFKRVVMCFEFEYILFCEDKLIIWLGSFRIYIKSRECIL